ncbi:uncharacterized protein LOC133782087 isoform X2 [Humulus lupulus]|uniref:uncharacterized protein LOC133782087 isoform X2 n=1 Tax=Humulus lupulus TaxID=3486 RepID=UPI002B40FA0D|nr:uncharacterized protein LOC133782087 isoform X2 [Humulus lupulus]
MMKKTVVAVMIMFLVFSYSERVAADAFDCLDGCITGCVSQHFRDTRLGVRCDRKCEIRCGPVSLYVASASVKADDNFALFTN